MGTFKMNVGRTLRAMIEGTYGVDDSFFEFIDNSEAANASNVCIHVLKGADSPVSRIVISDDGDSLKSKEMMDAALEFAGEIRERTDFEISEFGVGLKAAAFALGNLFTFISRNCDGDIFGSHLSLARISSEEKDNYEDPWEANPSMDYESLWNEFAIDKDATGTIIVLDDITQTTYKNCSTFIKGIRNPNVLGRRYRALIDSGRLALWTKNGSRGKKTAVESFDPLYRADSTKAKVLFDDSFVYEPKSGASPVRFNFAMTQLIDTDLTGPSNFGIIVKVAGIVVYRDKNALLGLYAVDKSHSYHWHLRGEIDFATKSEFMKVMNFTSHKHAVSVHDKSFSDWLRDSKIGKAYPAEVRRRKEVDDASTIVKQQESVKAEDSHFVTALNERKSVYGLSRNLVSYMGSIKGFKSRRFTDPRELASFEDGVIYCNLGNSVIATLLNSQAPKDAGARLFGRALATAHALKTDLEGNKTPLSVEEYESFLGNLVATI